MPSTQSPARCCIVFCSLEVMMRVGFIGLGRMGQAMATRLLGGGHDVVVFNRTKGKTAEVLKAGASAAESIEEACAEREVVISMVTGDAALQEIALGPKGIRASLAPAAIHLAMGTH